MPLTQAKALALPPSTMPLTDRMLLKRGWPELVPVVVKYAVATAKLLAAVAIVPYQNEMLAGCVGAPPAATE